LAIFAITLSGYGDGLRFFLTPDFTVLTNPMIWSAAFGQAFFSLSVGFGALITYGSYLNRETNIPRSSLIITVSDLFVAMLAGLTIFPIVFTFDLKPTMGSELAFSTLPRAFELMTYGQVLAVTFFLMLFFAALTSAIAMLEVNVAAFMGATKMSRRRTSLILTMLLLLVGLPAGLSYTPFNLSVGGVKILDFMDNTLGTYGLPITALLTTLTFTWFLKKEVLDIELKDAKRWGTFVYPVAKYFVPPVLIIATALKFILNFDVGAMHFVPGVEFIGSLAGGIGALIILGCLFVLGVIIFKYRQRRGKLPE
jgi:NSS family neurotransmitter:Na+ symporter